MYKKNIVSPLERVYRYIHFSLYISEYIYLCLPMYLSLSIYISIYICIQYIYIYIYIYVYVYHLNKTICKRETEL
jgi:hypothetical protein